VKTAKILDDLFLPHPEALTTSTTD